jgi:hypothetical protein
MRTAAALMDLGQGVPGQAGRRAATGGWHTAAPAWPHEGGWADRLR